MVDMVFFFFFGSLIERSALNPLDNSNRHLLFSQKVMKQPVLDIIHFFAYYYFNGNIALLFLANIPLLAKKSAVHKADLGNKICQIITHTHTHTHIWKRFQFSLLLSPDDLFSSVAV